MAMIITLTTAGKRKARDVTLVGNESSLIHSLEEGPQDTEDLARDLGTSKAKISKTALKLAKKGLVRQDE